MSGFEEVSGYEMLMRPEGLRTTSECNNNANPIRSIGFAAQQSGGTYRYVYRTMPDFVLVPLEGYVHTYTLHKTTNLDLSKLACSVKPQAFTQIDSIMAYETTMGNRRLLE